MKIKQLIIPRVSNDIQELQISYGLFSILLDMDYGFDVTLKRKKGAYIIDLEEEIETEHIIIIPSENDTDIKNVRINGKMNKKDFNGQVRAMFGTPDDFGDYTGGYFNNNDGVLDKIFCYYATLDDSFVEGFDKLIGNYVSGVYTAGGIRLISSPQGLKTPSYELRLSILGYFRTTNCIKVGDKGNEITWMAIPSEKGVTYINKWSPYTFVSKKTGMLTRLSKVYDSSETITSASIKVKMQLELMLSENLEDMEGFYELNTYPTKNKPLSDKVYLRKWLNASERLLMEFSNLLSFSVTDFEIKDYLSKFINKQGKKEYSDLIRILANKSKFPTFRVEEMKEIAKMVNKQNILEFQAVKEYADMLNRFMYKDIGVGYTTQRELMAVSNSSKLLGALTNMNVMYQRKYKQIKVDEKSVQELYKLVLESDNHFSKDVANAILLLSTVKTEEYIQNVENKRIKNEEKKRKEELKKAIEEEAKKESKTKK